MICAIACGVDLAHAATTYSASVTKSYLGWLDQYSLDTSTYHHVGPEACVPTTATNALTYLQRSAPSLFGTSLTGSGYTDWKAVDATLSSPGYMNTSVTNGTYLYTIPYALTQFVVDDRGFDSVKFSGMFEP
ncbi:MAG TPA: hypothetical protein VNB29_04095, partial [Chthoniobacterales bacterium]|nr:hypothetical protein [Chthoniobacterales bacterium]